MVEEGYLRGGSTAVRQLLTAFKLFNPARPIPFRRKSNIPPFTKAAVLDTAYLSLQPGN